MAEPSLLAKLNQALEQDPFDAILGVGIIFQAGQWIGTVGAFMLPELWYPYALVGSLSGLSIYYHLYLNREE